MNSFKIKKADIIALGIVAAACIAALLFYLFSGKNGAAVTVEIDGIIVGEYPLYSDAEITLSEHNTLVISDGKAKMEWADCRDKICVNHAAISKEGQSIVCLPNKTVVTVTGGAAAENDAVAG